jgi:hypothetical protein
MHMNSKSGDLAVIRKLTERSTSSPNMGPFGPRMGVGVLGA